jgi:hypothetical protein
MTGSPLVFMGTIDEESVAVLIRDIEARAPHEDLVEVVFAGSAGFFSAAFAFMNWMHGYAWRSRVRAVAAAELATNAVMMFLAFERRTADPMASVSLVNPDSRDPAGGAVAESFVVLERILAHSVITRTTLSLADVRSRIDGGAPLLGEELWSSGFCNEPRTDADDEAERTDASDDRAHAQDAQTPILFMDLVTFETVSALIGELVACGDTGGTVVIATKGGTLAAAQGFWSWLRRYPARHRFLAVAGGLVASAGVTLFAAFERRSADPWATVSFHDVTFDRRPEDQLFAAYAASMQGLLHAWFKTRFNASDKALDALADSLLPLTGVGLRKLRICTVEPDEPHGAATPGVGSGRPPAVTTPGLPAAATVTFGGTPDLAAVHGLVGSLTELAATQVPVRVEFSSRGCAPGVGLLDYLVWLGLASWLRRCPWVANVSAVATEPIDVPTLALFLAFDVRSVAAGGSLCLNATVEGAPPLDLRHALGDDATYQAGSEGTLRSHPSWVFMELLLRRTRISSEQALEWNSDRRILTSEQAERFGFSSR